MATNLGDRSVDFYTAMKALQGVLQDTPPPNAKPNYEEIRPLVIGMSNYFWTKGYDVETNKMLRTKLLSIATGREITTTYDLSTEEAQKIRRFLFSGYSLTREGLAIFGGMENFAKGRDLPPEE